MWNFVRRLCMDMHSIVCADKQHNSNYDSNNKSTKTTQACFFQLRCMRQIHCLLGRDVTASSVGVLEDKSLPSRILKDNFEVLDLGLESRILGLLILMKIIENAATRQHILKLKCTKFDFGWGSSVENTFSASTHVGGSMDNR